MYPNQPSPPPYQPPTQTPGQPPVDYLNQIAPQAPQKGLVPKGPKLIIAVLLALVVVVIIISVVLNIFTTAARRPIEQLGARMTATQGVVEAAQPNLKSSQVRNLNSNLRLYFTDTNRDLAAPLASAGVALANIPDSVTAAEAATTAGISERLEDARLNAVFDRTYAREMAFQLDTLLALMQQIYTSTNSPSLKTYLEEAYKDLEPSQEGFAEFNELNS